MKKLILILIVIAFNTALGQGLKLTFPNGGEKLIAGSDTTITWEGVSTSDTVRLE